jgi:hypothetical protein
MLLLDERLGENSHGILLPLLGHESPEEGG